MIDHAKILVEMFYELSVEDRKRAARLAVAWSNTNHKLPLIDKYAFVMYLLRGLVDMSTFSNSKEEVEAAGPFISIEAVADFIHTVLPKVPPLPLERMQ